MTLPRSEHFHIRESAIASPYHNSPPRDGLSMFLIFDNPRLLQPVKSLRQFRRWIPDKHEVASSESRGVAQRIRPPKFVLTMPVTHCQAKRIYNGMIFAIKSYLARQRPARGSEDRLDAFRTKLGTN